MASRLRRTVVLAMVVAGAAIPAMSALSTGAVAAPAIPPAAVIGGDFIAADLARNGDAFPSQLSPTSPDTGLVGDGVMALTAAGAHRDEAVRATEVIRKAYFSSTLVISGTVAKYILVAADVGVDPHHWGVDADRKPVDLVARLQSTLNPAGRYTNGGTSADYDLSNVFSQSLAMMAMHPYATTTQESSSVAYLLRQQCPAGGFRLAPPVGGDAGTCRSDADSADGPTVDNTAMAVWALATLRAEPAAMAKAVRWMDGQQDRSGGFGTAVNDKTQIADSLNANSTGLATLALTRAGDRRAAGRAARWLTGLQLPATATPAELRGAVAYSPAEKAKALADGPGYWANAGRRDQLRRATTQAVLGLAAVPPAPPAASPPTSPPTSPSSRSAAGRPPSSPSHPHPTAPPPQQPSPRHPSPRPTAARSAAPAPTAPTTRPGDSTADGVGPGRSRLHPDHSSRPGRRSAAGRARTAATLAPSSSPASSAPTPTGLGSNDRASADTSAASWFDSPTGIAVSVLVGLALGGGTFWFIRRRAA